MLITIRVPDKTVRLEYSIADENGYIGDTKPVTMGQIVKVEPDCNDPAKTENLMIDLGEV